MNPLSTLTPWPWKAIRGGSPRDPDDETRWVVVTDADPNYFVATIENGAPGDTLETEGHKANLFALAPDHALMLAAQTAGKCHVGPPDMAICEPAILQIDGDQTTWAIEVDAFGCPILTPEIRAALKAALGIP